jgi:hypothetical protein
LYFFFLLAADVDIVDVDVDVDGIGFNGSGWILLSSVFTICVEKSCKDQCFGEQKGVQESMLWWRSSVLKKSIAFFLFFFAFLVLKVREAMR